jgi:hypothetical protein
MSRVLELLTLVDTEPPAVPGISNDTLQKAKDGDIRATATVLGAAADYLDDGAFFIDELAHVVGAGVDEFVAGEPETARTLVLRMEHHLINEPWERRDFDHYNVPLRWIHRIAEAAAAVRNFDLMEDAASALFRQDPRLDRYRQKDRSREWLARIDGEAGRRVAHLLRENRAAAAYYGELRRAADGRIRAALLEAQSR